MCDCRVSHTRGMSESTCSRERANRLLAAASLTDEEFWEATAYLSTRFDRRSNDFDIRSDDGAPKILFAWMRHARLRVPDFRLWGVGCSIEVFFSTEMWLLLPDGWCRFHILQENESLRSDPAWGPAFLAAFAKLNSVPNGALSCCAADRFGLDPYPLLWRYLLRHLDSFEAWTAVCFRVDEARMPAFANLIEAELLPRVPMLEKDAHVDDQGRASARGMRWILIRADLPSVLQATRRFRQGGPGWRGVIGERAQLSRKYVRPFRPGGIR